jgi:TetR/AcrR family transcriptional repressor of mexJK operon
MAAAFARLSAEGLLDVPDATMAANHFVGMLLWIPINRAMFTGNDSGATKAELARHARATTTVFLEAYGPRR